jgi:heptaprenyl diphosphate synthase
MKRIYSNRKIGIMAVFIAIGLVLQYFESRIIITPVPGGKLGLANIVTVINIFLFGGGNATVIAIIRAFLGALVSGGAATVPYSVAGAALSTLAMWIVKKYFYPKVSIIGISIIGAVFHNIAQLLIASAVYVSGYIFSYLPGLLVLALVSGTVTGYAALIFAKRALKEDIV